MNEQTPLLLPNKHRAIGVCCRGPNDNQPCCSQSLGQDDYCVLAEQPWRFKAMALVCALFLAVGSHFAAHTLGAMKNTIKQEFGISNSQYGVIQSSVSIVNTILPVLGGFFLDTFGAIPGSIATTTLITSGNVLVALSTSSANLPLMIFGRFLYGIGSGTVVIVQETILSQWFKGQSLAAVVALMLTVSRLASFLAQATVVPIANWTGWYGYGFWFSALLCGFSFVVNLLYVTLIRKISWGQGCRNESQLAHQQKLQAVREKRRFAWSKLLYFPHAYWLVAAMEFLLGGAWGCFLHINSEYVKFRFGYTDAHAAATASVAQILPIFLMPVLGFCLDRFGKRTWMMLGSGLSLMTSLVLLEFTLMPPILGMLIFSISLSLGPVGLVSSVPIMLPLSLVGTGMGIIKSGTNIGASIFDIVTGLLQDADPNKGYDGVVRFFIVIAMLATLAGATLTILDSTMYDGLLDRSASSRPARPNQILPKLQANWVYGTIFVSLAIVSWSLFAIFVLF